MFTAVSILSGIIASIFILPGIIRFLEQNTEPVKNYRGIFVINSAGIFFAIYILIVCTLYLICLHIFYNIAAYDISIFAVSAGVLSASFTGTIDDKVCSFQKGFSGHGQMLLKGKITSGIIKALVGILVSVMISLSMNIKGVYLVLNILIICLMQNFINLMDLRPGRAVKAYLALSLIGGMFIAFNPIMSGINIGMIIMLLFYLKYDLCEVCMMGDSGSNSIGILLGIIVSSSENIIYKCLVLGLLTAIHVYAERSSISRLIDNVDILKYIDMMGRKESYIVTGQKRDGKKYNKPRK